MKTAIFGLMRGDEGKGKIVDYFSNTYDVIVRYAGGPNAGHTIYRNDNKIVLHQIPSGILNRKICIIGRGCVVDLKKLYNEMQMIQKIYKEMGYDEDVRKYVHLSQGAHVIFQSYIQEDIDRENSGKGNGSTKCGIAQAYRNKFDRKGFRVFDIFEKDDLNISLEKDLNLTNDEFDYLKDIIDDDVTLLNSSYCDLNVLFEGAQGVLLDIDSPYYPNVSSSSPGIGGILTGTGINPNYLIKNFNAIGVAKCYMSSVGDGEFLTELNDENAKLIRDAGNEYGATTGRPRKIGWLDLPLLSYAITISGINELCMTRLDTLAQAMKDKGYFKVCVGYKTDRLLYYDANIWNLKECTPVYEEFPIWKEASLSDSNFRSFIEYLKNYLSKRCFNCTLKYVSIGKNKEDLIKIS